MSLPRYSEYKDSGVPWLGSVPAHWNVRPLKFEAELLTSNVDKKSYEDEIPVLLCNYTDVYYNDRIVHGMDFMPATASSSQIERFTLRAGDTIITKDSETADDIATSAYVSSDMPGVVCGYHLAVIRPGSITSGPYNKYLFDCHFLKAYFEVSVNGLTRVGLSKGALGGAFIPCPTVVERVAIAAFLDRETGKIDALIAEQEKLLTLLAEKRQTTISHAVTRGLNPNAPMKDSGVPWLGEVPTHWDVTRCGRYLSVLSGFAFPSAGFDHTGNGTRLLRGVNVGVSNLRWDDVVCWERTPADGLDAYELSAGDLVIGMDRPLISAGMRVAKVSDDDLPCLLLQRVASLRTSAELKVDFLMRYLSTEMFVAHFSPDTTGVSVPHISPDQIKSFVIAIPPIEEQQRILRHIEAELARLDRLAAQAERGVALLRERRSALIAAAVTGKIDVRKAA